MVTVKNNTLVVLFILAGVISLVFCGVFVSQGFNKSHLITQAMQMEKVSYTSAGGDIVGIIDTPQEAQIMAGILREHRNTNYGLYAELERDDPNRDQILKAMTMENSLNLAVVGYGLTDIVKALGAFMGVLGIIFIGSGVALIRSQTK